MIDPPFRQIKSGSFATAATLKAFPCSQSNGQPLVVGAFTAAAALPGRRRIRVSNDDATNAFRVGDSSITAGIGGTAIWPKTYQDFDLSSDAAFYVIADAATPQASWSEFA